MKREPTGIAGFLYRTFRKDIGRKAMALLLAVILWVYLDQKVVVDKDYYLRIRVVTEDEYAEEAQQDNWGYFLVIPPQLMEVEGVSEKELTVSLSGPVNLIPPRLRGRKDITMDDMRGRKEQRVPVFPLKRDFDALKGKERIGVDFSPHQFRVFLAEREAEQVVLTRDNVEAFLGLEQLQAQGREIAEVVFDPGNIFIEGPAPAVEEIRADNTRLKLEPMKLEGVERTTLDGFLGLSKTMRAKKISIRGADSVRVTVTLAEKKGDYLLEGLSVAVRFHGDFLSKEERTFLALDSELPDPATVNVRFRGPRPEIDRLKGMERRVLKRKITPYIDLEEGGGEPRSRSFQEFLKTLKPGSYVVSLLVSWGEFDPEVLEVIAEPRTVVVKPAKPEG